MDEGVGVELSEPVSGLDSNALANASTWAVRILAILTLLTVAALWLVRTNIVVACPAQIVPRGKPTPIHSHRDGVIAAVLVREGDAVTKGQPLCRLDRAEVSQQMDSALNQLAAARQRRTLLDRSKIVREELARKERASLGARLAISRGKARRTNKLVDLGLTTRDENEGARVAAVLDQQNLEQSQLGAAQELLQLDVEMQEADERVAVLEAHIAELKLEDERSLVVAQQSGVVQDLKALVPGTLLRAGEPLGWLVSDTDLIAEVNVPSTGIGFLSVGQQARLKLKAYPFQEFGVAEGVVTSISKDAVRAEDGSIQPFHLARVRITRAPGGNTGKSLPLRAGMLGDAEIVLRRQRIAVAILSPWNGAAQSISLAR